MYSAMTFNIVLFIAHGKNYGKTMSEVIELAGEDKNSTLFLNGCLYFVALSSFFWFKGPPIYDRDTGTF